MAHESGRSGAAQGSSNRRTIITFAGLTLVILATLGVRLALDREPGVTYSDAPLETHGHWITGEARYAGRAIEVSARDVTLHRGEAGPLSGRLTVARELQVRNQRVIRLEYVTSEGPDAIDIVPQGEGVMHLRNQPGVVWTTSTAGAPPVLVAGPPVTPPVTERAPIGGPVGGLPINLILGVLLAGVGVLALVVVGSRVFASSEDRGLAPSVVRGVWTTMDDRSEGRTIRVAPGYVFSHFSPGAVRIGGVITNAEEQRVEEGRLVSLEFVGRSGEGRLDMMIDRSGHMRLQGGPKSVWSLR